MVDSDDDAVHAHDEDELKFVMTQGYADCVAEIDAEAKKNKQRRKGIVCVSF